MEVVPKVPQKIPVRPVLKQRPELVNNSQTNCNVPRQSNEIKKCLFGTPDPQDIEKLVKEQMEVDRSRIKERFGFDIEDIENLKCNEQTPPTKKRKIEATIISQNRVVVKKRRRLFMHHDQKITGGLRIIVNYITNKAKK